MIKLLRIPILMWGVATAFYAFEIMLKSSMGSVSEVFSSQLSLNNTQLASLSSAFYFTYILLQIPAGILIDKYGVRKMLPIAISAAVISTLLFSLNNNFVALMVARILMGVCGAFGFLCAITLAVQWFSVKRFALLAGLTNFVGYLGGSLSGMPLAMIVTESNWQIIYFCFSLIGVLILIITILIVYDNKSKKKLSRENIIFKDIFKAIYSQGIISNGLFCAATMGATFALCDLWGREFLASLGYSEFYASLAGNSLIFIGIAITAPLWGLMTKYVAIRTLLSIGALLGVVSSVLYLYIPIPVVLLCILSLGIGASQSSHILSFSYVHKYSHKAVISAVFAFVNLCGIIGGATVQLVIGIFLDLGVTKSVVVCIIPALFFIAFLLTLFMKKD
ncbi:MFS transporter [Francisella sp. Scap27]|uniref:MFS transporter n=1 Tax=Francisella sp. Scap27 TaxID=2589986 RepID=UPI0015C0428F|nr:MFS transporter [Francisella sp. Scap27]QLE79555.1 MFS transporter [Francisella sp. Scap27]